MRRLIIVAAILIGFVGSSEARRGCCSWHGGVAGCDERTGRLVCRDGTYSPTCTCAVVEPTTDISSVGPIRMASNQAGHDTSECLAIGDEDNSKTEIQMEAKNNS